METSDASQPRSPRSLQRRLLFAAVLLLLNYGAMELLAFLAYAVRYGEPFSFAALQDRQRSVAQETTGLGTGGDPEAGPRERVIHPYLGFIREPTAAPSASCKVNSHGFFGAEDFRRQTPDRLTVVITGGSVARNFFCGEGRGVLSARLRKIPRFAGKRINWIGLAYGGFKQPQQLMALSYLLVLGVRVDLVLALDGFNEISGVDEWSFLGVHPTYPENWSNLVRPLQGKGQTRRIARIQGYRATRRRVNATLERLPFSVTAGLLWSLLDEMFSAVIHKENKYLMDEGDRRRRQRLFFRDGPPFDGKDPDYMARVWFRAAQGMAALARQHGFALFLFTQPSQYVTNSKVLSAAERRLRVLNRHSQAPCINRGYSRLRTLGPRLAGRDVFYHDLSYIFRQVKEAVYTDDLCHVNQRGDELLAQAMGQKIQQQLHPGPALAR